MSVLLVNANSLHIPLADESVHCAITSPPYYSLRDYQIAGQLGLEASPELYVDNMVKVFREVWRVLRKDGTLWLNMGDSYAGSNQGFMADGTIAAGPKQATNKGTIRINPEIVRSKRMERGNGRWGGGNLQASGDLKPKDLVGIPWMVAFALRADGWWLRSDIIWSKPNPMPESVTDRPTKSHEYLFLLTKRANYYYDCEAIREGDQVYFRKAGGYKSHHEQMIDDYSPNKGKGGFADSDVTTVGRNRRTVWDIPTYAWSGAHFATYPPALVEPCIRAGSSERGVCPKCGAPWERIVIKPEPPDEVFTKTKNPDDGLIAGHRKNGEFRGAGQKLQNWMNENPTQTIGWQPTCACDAGDPIHATVFDPFVGSGTTLQVARQLGRHGVGCDLSLPYLRLARERLEMDALDAWTSGRRGETVLDDLPLFMEQP